MEIKKLIDTCYLVIDGHGNKLGLGLVRNDKIVFTHDLEVYNSFEDIGAKYEERIIYTEIATNEDSTKIIQEFPIKHEMFVDEKFETINNFETYTYKVREESNIRFCAGWWIVSTDSVNRLVISPKTSTLNNFCVGPFKNKFDCQAELTRLNRIKREEL